MRKEMQQERDHFNVKFEETKKEHQRLEGELTETKKDEAHVGGELLPSVHRVLSRDMPLTYQLHVLRQRAKRSKNKRNTWQSDWENVSHRSNSSPRVWELSFAPSEQLQIQFT